MALAVDIRKRLGNFSLDVRFETESGPLALLGASGCGKSLTLRCIAGILTPDEGEILLDGEPLYDSARGVNLPPQRRGVGYLFQQYALFPHMTVRQNIAAAIGDRGRRREETAELLRRFRLEDAAEKRPFQISGGQQQRTALARILAARPRVILLDEPLSALDVFLRRQVEEELVQALEDFPGPVVWVTHDRGEACRNCPRACVLDRGRSQPARAMEDLLACPGTLAAAKLSGCENFPLALPRDTAVFLPQWGVLLECGRAVPESLGRIGLRAESVRPEEGAGNAVPCRVVRAVRDLDGMMVRLRPEGGEEDAPPLLMKLPAARWEPLAGRERLTVSIAREDVLFLTEDEEPRRGPSRRRTAPEGGTCENAIEEE